MDITNSLLPHINFINGYSDKGFKINNQLILGDIILSPSKVDIWKVGKDIFELAIYHRFFENILTATVEAPIVLIGTGAHFKTPPLELVELLKGHNIYPEIMSTPAACRTYNVLISERTCVYALLAKIN